MSEVADLTDASALMALLEIRFDEISATRVRGSVAADERHHQPWGIVHGGLYTTVIETFATTGAYEAVKDQGQQAVGSPTPPTSCGPTAADDSTLSPCQSIKGEHSSCGRSRCADQKTKSSSLAAKCDSRTSQPRRPEPAADRACRNSVAQRFVSTDRHRVSAATGTKGSLDATP